MNTTLARRAVRLFTLTMTSSISSVRHARRQWIRSVIWMREREQSRWIMDNPVQRMSHAPVMEASHA